MSLIFSFNNNTYLTTDTLINGCGYLALFNNTLYIQIDSQLTHSPIPLTEGWNLIGPFHQNVLISQIYSNPSNIINSDFFEFNGNQLIESNILKPGKGYWVRSASNGMINFNTDIISKGAEDEPISNIDQNWDKIKFTDSDGNIITLYFAEDAAELNKFELPPIPPRGIFDVRFSSERFVESMDDSQEILIHSDKYPITITTEGIRVNVKDRINGIIINEELEDGNKLIISNNNTTTIQVSGSFEDIMPVKYNLAQNYPNPFNPSTVISWQSPVASHQTIKVYDVLGNEVSTLVDEYREAGNYEVEFKSSTGSLQLASGIYFYKL